mmetsp:Transcript_41698/g.132624  ORF Transcript_41698/g.132624 Transcript_41698/m.132624 type:complete len:220 (-) Transcript_41698:41-700(-)
MGNCACKCRTISYTGAHGGDCTACLVAHGICNSGSSLQNAVSSLSDLPRDSHPLFQSRTCVLGQAINRTSDVIPTPQTHHWQFLCHRALLPRAQLCATSVQPHPLHHLCLSLQSARAATFHLPAGLWRVAVRGCGALCCQRRMAFPAAHRGQGLLYQVRECAEPDEHLAPACFRCCRLHDESPTPQKKRGQSCHEAAAECQWAAFAHRESAMPLTPVRK